MSAAQYLKRLVLESVEDLAEVNTQFLKRVNVVEFLDQNGDVWNPSAPEPDPD